MSNADRGGRVEPHAQAGGTDRALDEAKAARIEPGRTPPRQEISPDRRAGNPAVSPEARREISTPAEGAGPLPTAGDEVDPGAG
jgi:hypothetical protein